MVVTLTGTNKFVLQTALAALTAEFIREQGEIAVERLDGEEATFDRLRESLQSTPFLANKKMVILHNGSANKQFVEQAEKLLTELPETTEAVLVEPKLDKRSSYYKFLKKSSELRDFTELDENGLAQWLVESAQAREGRLSISDARYLAERVGLDQQLLDNELDKLLLYSIARETKLNPYVIQKAQTGAAGITFGHLKQLISDLLVLDVRSKRESIDLDEALQLFLMKIAV